MFPLLIGKQQDVDTESKPLDSLLLSREPKCKKEAGQREFQAGRWKVGRDQGRMGGGPAGKEGM